MYRATTSCEQAFRERTERKSNSSNILGALSVLKTWKKRFFAKATIHYTAQETLQGTHPTP